MLASNAKAIPKWFYMGDATLNRTVLKPGDLLEGKYRIERKLAEGGMGAVYHAIQEPLGRDVALKVLKSFDETEDERQNRFKRFFREAAICSRLNHPNTVTIIDYGELSGGDGFFLVMEFLRGISLRDLLNKHGTLTTSLALHIAIQIAGSLSDAHKASVVHRDLKPPNIMLVERGGDPYFVKVVDFGLVKELNRGDETGELTAEDTLIGSPMYMAPERFLYHSADSPAVDIYALGIMMYEMLCGRPPFIRDSDSTVHRIMMQHIQDEPPPMSHFRPELDLPEGLEQLVMRCLAKDPVQRLSSMDTLVHLLKSCQQGMPIEVPPVHDAPRPAVKESGSDQMVAPEDTQNTVRLQTGEDSRPALPSLMTSVPDVQKTAAQASKPFAAPTHQTLQPEAKPPEAKPSKLPKIAIGVVVVLIAALVAFNLMKGPAPTSLVVETTPPGAQVEVDGQAVGVSPVTLELPLERSGTLRITKEGYKPYERGISPSSDPVVIALPLDAIEVAAHDVTPKEQPKDAADVAMRAMLRDLHCSDSFDNLCTATSTSEALRCMISSFSELDTSCQSGLRELAKTTSDDAELAAILANVPDAPKKPVTKRSTTKSTKTNDVKPTIKLGR